LAAEYRESQRSGALEFLIKRWQREIETPMADTNPACLIEPGKIHELTISFFQRESAFINGVGIQSSITRLDEYFLPGLETIWAAFKSRWCRIAGRNGAIIRFLFWPNLGKLTKVSKC